MSSPKTYRQLQNELDSILSKLQSAELDIDEALKLYNRGQQLVEELERYLKNAKNKVEKLRTKK